MKKCMRGLSAVMVVLVTLFLCTASSCQPEQVKVVAQNAGLFSAVGWIAYDNPSTNEIAAVESVLHVIEENAADVQAGATYVEVLYPEVLRVIATDIKPQYRPVCKAGALSILSGLDMLFAANPSWKEKQDEAIPVVNAFLLGAKNGLSMAEDDPVMVEARRAATRRARLLVEEEPAEEPTE